MIHNGKIIYSRQSAYGQAAPFFISHVAQWEWERIVYVFPRQFIVRHRLSDYAVHFLQLLFASLRLREPEIQGFLYFQPSLEDGVFIFMAVNGFLNVIAQQRAVGSKMLAEISVCLDTVAAHSIRVGFLAYKGYRLHNAGHCKTSGAVLVYQALDKFNIMLFQKIPPHQFVPGHHIEMVRKIQMKRI